MRKSELEAIPLSNKHFLVKLSRCALGSKSNCEQLKFSFNAQLSHIIVNKFLFVKRVAIFNIYFFHIPIIPNVCSSYSSCSLFAEFQYFVDNFNNSFLYLRRNSIRRDCSRKCIYSSCQELIIRCFLFCTEIIND